MHAGSLGSRNAAFSPTHPLPPFGGGGPRCSRPPDDSAASADETAEGGGGRGERRGQSRRRPGRDRWHRRDARATCLMSRASSHVVWRARAPCAIRPILKRRLAPGGPRADSAIGRVSGVSTRLALARRLRASNKVAAHSTPPRCVGVCVGVSVRICVCVGRPRMRSGSVVSRPPHPPRRRVQSLHKRTPKNDTNGPRRSPAK